MKKTDTIKLCCVTMLCVLSFTLKSQGPPGGNWELGGNNAVPPNEVTATNNILGTIPNLPLRIITNNTERFRFTEWGSLQGWPGSTALGIRSIAFGLNTTASGNNSQAFGNATLAGNINTFAAGRETQATGEQAFSTGNETQAQNVNSSSFGNLSVASGEQAFATGNETQASGNNASSFGFRNSASGFNSFATGAATLASGASAATFGRGSQASGSSAAAFGSSFASGTRSTAFGSQSQASGTNSFATGILTQASGNNSSAFGNGTLSNSLNTFAAGNETQAIGANASSFGSNSLATGDQSFAIGFDTEASGVNTFAGGSFSQATGDESFSSGGSTIASGDGSVAFGYSTTASGRGAFAIGPQNAVASGNGSFAGGFDVIANDIGSFVFGENAAANGFFSVGFGMAVVAGGDNSVVIGYESRANGNHSFVLGKGLPGNPLINTIHNSLMIGFESDISTFFVGEGSGAVTTGNVGIGALAGMGGLPNTKLEINSDGNSPEPAGLRFTNLLSTATPVVNPGDGVLSVNSAGDVIYVEDGGLGAGDGDWFEVGTATPPNAITDPIYREAEAGIGVTTPAAKLDVFTSNTGNSNETTINAFNNNSSGLGLNIGVKSVSDGGDETFGGWFESIGAQSNRGIRSSAQNGTSNIGGEFIGFSNGGTTSGIGVTAHGSGSGSVNFGVRGSASGATVVNYAIFGSVSGSGAFPPSPPSGSYAGYFDGDVVRTGNDNFSSDQALKQNIDTISEPMDIIAQLKPKSFYFDTTGNPNMALSTSKQYGFIAQDVEPVLPELVSDAIHPAVYDSVGNIIYPSMTYKTLNYQAFIALLMGGIQEQQSTIDSMQTKIDSLEALPAAHQQAIDSLFDMMAEVQDCLGNLPPGLGCNGNGNARTGNENNDATHKWDELAQTVELNDARTIILHQNDPNPFAEQTVIRYEIPETVRDARIIFHNMSGVVIKEVRIDTRGQEGRLQVYASDLSTGVYTYSIIADGKLIDTKKMVKR